MSIDATYRLHLSILSLVVALAAPSVTEAADPRAREASEDERLEEAHRAVGDAEFEVLVPVLEPLVAVDDGPVPPMASLLYALGLVYEAPPEAGDDYFEVVDDHIERALEADADIELDPLLYPPTFIARVEELRRRSSAPTRASADAPEPTVFYFERHVEVRSRLPLFFPGGVGQFYNDANFRGITFASVQAAGLGANVVGHWMIESMRTSSGHIPTEDLSRARDWRRLQYAGLATFVGGWIIGVIEAKMGFEARTVHIRTLDSPPEEMAPFSDSSTSFAPSLQLEWSIGF